MPGAILPEVFSNEVRYVLVERAGVGLLLDMTQLGEQVENALRFHLKLPRQLINADFSHK